MLLNRQIIVHQRIRHNLINLIMHILGILVPMRRQWPQGTLDLARFIGQLVRY